MYYRYLKYDSCKENKDFVNSIVNDFGVSPFISSADHNKL